MSPATRRLAAASLLAGPALGAGPRITVEPAAILQGSYAVVRVTASGTGTVFALGRSWPLYPDGDGLRAIVAAPLTAKPGRVTVTARLPRGRTATAALRVRPRTAPRMLLLKGISVTTASAAVLHENNVTVSRAYRTSSPVAAWLPGPWCRLPLPGPLTSGFGIPRSYSGTAAWAHKGADLASPAGWPILAPMGGTVVFSAKPKMYGNTIVLDHGQGVHTVYLHMASREVKVGEVVDAGQIIGTVGATGFAKGAHLHFGTLVGPVAVDPMEMAARGLP